MARKTVIILWRDSAPESKEQRLQVEFSTEGFKFSTLDAWVRARFGLSAASSLRFSRKGLETEFVPDESWIKEKSDEAPTVIVTCVNRAENDTSKEKKTKSASDNNNVVFALTFWILTLSIAYFGAFPQHHLLFGFSIHDFFNAVDTYLIDSSIIIKRGCAMEACISMISWSLTNLFIRRLLNPETAHNAFQKYSADAFFGGIASATGIILKYHLQMRLAM